jgi:hypothetical protein
MRSAFGSAGSLSRSAGGLAAGLQQRNRYWIQFLDERIAALEGKMRASGDSGAPDAAAPARAAGSAPAPAAWGWPGADGAPPEPDGEEA